MGPTGPAGPTTRWIMVGTSKTVGTSTILVSSTIPPATAVDLDATVRAEGSWCLPVCSSEWRSDILLLPKLEPRQATLEAAGSRSHRQISSAGRDCRSMQFQRKLWRFSGRADRTEHGTPLLPFFARRATAPVGRSRQAIWRTSRSLLTQDPTSFKGRPAPMPSVSTIGPYLNSRVSIMTKPMQSSPKLYGACIQRARSLH